MTFTPLVLWSNRPVKVDSDQIKRLIKKNQLYTMISTLKISKLRIKNYLHQLGYVNHFEIWFLHKKKKLLGHI